MLLWRFLFVGVIVVVGLSVMSKMLQAFGARKGERSEYSIEESGLASNGKNRSKRDNKWEGEDAKVVKLGWHGGKAVQREEMGSKREERSSKREKEAENG